MNTNYLTTLDDRARALLMSAHRTEMVAARMAVPMDAEGSLMHRRRIEEINLLPASDRIALDREEFVLIGGVPA